MFDSKNTQHKVKLSKSESFEQAQLYLSQSKDVYSPVKVPQSKPDGRDSIGSKGQWRDEASRMFDGNSDENGTVDLASDDE